MAAWLAGARLMSYEYSKRLSEAFYAHWFFWSTMCMNNLVFLVLNYTYYEWFLVAINFVSFCVNCGLCVMMVITKRRTALNPRPDT
jgi:hypothetical protein